MGWILQTRFQLKVPTSRLSKLDKFITIGNDEWKLLLNDICAQFALWFSKFFFLKPDLFSDYFHAFSFLTTV